MSSDGCKSEFFFALNFFNFSIYWENEWVLVALVLPPCWTETCSTLWFLLTWLKNQTKWKSPFSSLSLKKYQFTLRSPLIRYMRFELTNKTSVIITLIQVQWNEQYNDNLAPVQIKIRVFDLRRAILWKFYFRFWNSELRLAMRLLSSYWKSIGRCNDFQKKISWWDTIYMI